MERRSLGSIIKAAVLAGVIGGLLTATFHYFLTEPVIAQAIAIEEMMDHHAGGAAHVSLVGRDVQVAGLFLGFLIYGLSFALLFSVGFHVVQGHLGNPRAWQRGILMALLAGWSVAIFPFLKYPGNPPGVGDPETIQQRQAVYLAFIALSVANTCFALVLERYLSRSASLSRDVRLHRLVPVLSYVVGAAILYLAMPVDPDSASIANNLVPTFRVLSITGLALFWLAFAGGFGWLIRPHQARAS